MPETHELKHADKATLEIMAANVSNPPAPHGLTKPCDDRYTAVHNSGVRALSAIRWIVMHSTEGDTALGAAKWFTNKASGGSAHLCVDDNYCFRTLADNRIPWAAPGANTNGFHIEQAGYARWTNLMWSSKHRNTLERAAYKAALHCRKFSIPPIWVDYKGLRDSKPGITSHMECTKAFGGSHTDPGAGWPRWWFMRRVRYWHKRLWHVKPVG